jgi:hypothetical protein
LIVAIVVQFLALLFGAITPDMGQTLLALQRVSIEYWLGVAIILLRRHNSMTRGDHTFLRFGLVPLLLLGTPASLFIWAYRGVT